ncbi:hypothetical protein OAA23_00135 [bacterium]|jgi:hypothetical protein|nr:hypothetical protein [bacterium]
MKNLITNYTLLMRGCETPLDYIVAIWVNLLGAIAITGLGKVLYELITNPSQFNNVTWGIFDTLG